MPLKQHVSAFIRCYLNDIINNLDSTKSIIYVYKDYAFIIKNIYLLLKNVSVFNF